MVAYRTCRLWCAAVVVLAASAGGAAAQKSPSQSPGKSSPKPPTPQQQLAAARARLGQAHEQVKAAWQKLKASRERMAQAQKDHAEVLEEMRRDETVDPLVRDAAARLATARDALEAERVKAMKPLRLKLSYVTVARELDEANIRLDELTKMRAKLDRQRLPVSREDEREIGWLSLRVLRLRDEAAALEDAVLDEHEGYQAASAEMDAALAEAAEAMKTTRELRRGNSQRKAAYEALRAASEEAAAAGKAYAEARRQRTAMAAAYLAAQAAVDRAERR